MRLTRACARGPGLAWQLPLLLRHAALCRLALPNLCLKLNLKEKNKTNPKQTKESGTSFLLDFSSSARGEGAVGSVMRERLAEPLIPPSLPASLPGVLGEGQGHRFRSETSCSLFRFGRNETTDRCCISAPGRMPAPPATCREGLRALAGGTSAGAASRLFPAALTCRGGSGRQGGSCELQVEPGNCGISGSTRSRPVCRHI